MYNKNNSKQTTENSRVKNKFSVVLVVILSLLMVFCATACQKKKTSTPESTSQSTPTHTNGVEKGDYYFYAKGVAESSITLDGTDAFTYKVGENSKTGTYTITEDDLTLTFSNTTDGEMSAKLQGNVLTVTYNDAQMRFYKDVTYTVSFDAKEGSAVAPVAVKNGTSVATFPANPTREGYLFAGWYSDSECKTHANHSAIITADTTYYAGWVTASEANYAVTFNYLDDVTANATVIAKNGKLSTVPTPTNGDYVFAGWWISDYEDANKLTRKYESTMTFNQNTTLYALWTEAQEGAKFSAPIVNVDTNGLSWNNVGSSVVDYTVEITTPAGNTENYTATQTSLNYKWADKIAGDYVITVKANATDEANSSDVTTRYYKNKVLARVSFFQVQGSTLVFTPVANATSYKISIVCGNGNHNHTNYDLGANNYYDFTNCTMTKEGISFVVTACADGYANSVSSAFVFERTLGAVENVTVDEADQTISWDAVENATSYVVTITCGSHTHEAENIGNVTSYSIKECSGNIAFAVYPVANGYNSPDATEYTYNKTALATPSGVKVDGNTIVWDTVDGATSYTVKVNDTEYANLNTNSFDTATKADWTKDTAYTVSVKANGASSSYWSDAITVYYKSMGADVEYSNGTATWNYVIGATEYEITVNDGEAYSSTTNSASVVFTTTGENTINVKAIGDGIEEQWATASVIAFEIMFDANGGNRVDSVYKALGDTIGVPAAATRAGYTFIGWYDAIGGADANANKLSETDVFTSIDTYYADWSANTYVASFSVGSNGEWADGNEPTVDVVYGTGNFTFPVPKNKVLTTIFVGWSLNANDTTSLVTNDLGELVEGFKWSFSENTTFHACYVSDVFRFALLADNTYAVRKGPNAKYASILTIPNTYEGLPVSTVSGLAFDYCQQAKIIRIPDSIQLVESLNAFSRCNKLEAIEIYDTGYTGEKRYIATEGVLVRLADTEHAIMETQIDFVPPMMTGVYTIPAEVTFIPYHSFYGSKLSEVNIPESVKIVETGAFSKCENLTTINFLPASSDYVEFLTIQDGAFNDCKKLSVVNLPARTVSLGMDDETNSLAIFEDCFGISAINIEAGSNKYGSFEGVLTTAKSAATASEPYSIIYCPQSKTGDFAVPSDITAIKPYAFYGCNKITSIDIHGLVTEIGDYAFYGCTAVETLTFSGISVQGANVGDYAFARNTSLRTINYERNSRVTVIGDGAFAYCSNLKEVTIPKTATYIGNEAYANATSVSKVIFAEGGKRLDFGERIFLNCKGLVDVSLPASLEELPLGMFEGCIALRGIEVDDANPNFCDVNGVVYSKNMDTIYYYSLKNGNFTLPNSVTTIMGGVFKGNRNITAVTFTESVANVGKEAFANCTSLKTITFDNPENAVTFGENVFNGCTLLNNVTIPVGLTEISDGMFRSCTSLKNITLHDGITRIGHHGLASTGAHLDSLPASLTSLGDYALAYTGLTSAELSENFTTLGKYAFFGCNGLTAIDFEGTNVTAIPEGCFKGTMITEIYIPKTVTYIGARAFEQVGSLTSLEFEQGDGEDLVIGDFRPYEGQFDYFTDLYSDAFSFTSISEIVFPERLTRIGDKAFYNCANLYTVEFAENSRLKTIGGYAFGWCTWLADYGELRLPASLQDLGPYAPAIGEAAFYYCDHMYNLYFEGAEVENPQGTLTINYQAFCGIGENNDDGWVYGAGDDGEVILPSNVRFAYRTYESRDIVDLVSGVIFTCCSWKIQEGSSNFVYIDENGFYYTTDRKTLILANTSSKTITIPKEVTNISTRAIKGGNSTSFTINFEAGGTETLVIGNDAFSGVASKITAINFPTDRPVSIGGKSGGGYSKLTSLTIPANVTDIGPNAFNGCSNLENLIFEEGENGSALSTISLSAFLSCTKLTSVTFPKGLKFIGESAFSGCTSLTTVNFNEDLDGIATGAFHKTAIEEVVLSKNVSYLGERAFGLNTSSATANTKLKKITLSEKLTSLDNVFALWNRQNGHQYSTIEEIIVPATSQFLSNGVKIVDGVEVADTRIVYSKDKTQVLYVAYKANVSDLVLDENVTTISNYAFYRKNIDSLTVTDKIIKIGDYAFYNSNISNLIFEDRTNVLEIGNYAFAGNDMEGTLEIPSATTFIGEAAFSGCSKVTAVSFGENSKLNEIGNLAFDGTEITSVEIPATVQMFGTAFSGISTLKTVTFAPNSAVTEIADSAFADCSALKTVDLPSGVYKIGAYAFNDTILESISLSKSVQEIGEYAFAGTSLTSVNIPGRVSNISNYAFYGCTSLATVNIGDGVETIGNYAFAYTAITSINVPSTASSIGDYVFYNCQSLNDVVLSSNLTSIGESAFENCSSLEAIALPAKVQTLSAKAFKGCSMLIDVTLPDSLHVIGDYAFENCSNLGSLVIPANVRELGLNPFKGCDSFAGMQIADGNDYYVVEEGILYNYEKTKIVLFPVGYTGEYVMPNTVSEIAEGLFANSQLTKVTVATSITEIPANAFNGSTQLTEVILHAGILSIGDNAFEDCINLTSIKSNEDGIVENRWPSQLDSIGSYAFSNVGLTSVEIPASVSQMGSYAFYKSNDITTLTFEQGGTEQLQIPNYAFYGVNAENVVLPFRVRFDNATNKVAVGNYAFAANPSLKTFEVENTGDSAGLDPYFTIGEYVFSGCTGLETVFLPKHLGAPIALDWDGDVLSSGVTWAIGTRAFSFGEQNTQNKVAHDTTRKYTTYGLNACISLKTVTIDLNPANKYFFGSSAFEGCSSLTSFTLPSDLETGGGSVFKNTAIEEIVLTNNPINSIYYNDKASMFNYNSNLKSITFRDYSSNCGWTSMPNYFIGASSIKTFRLPDSIKTIETSAFAGWTSIEEFIVSDNNTKFKVVDGSLYSKDGKKLIKYASGRPDTTYTLPASVTSIDPGALSDAPNLTEILVEEGNTKFQSIDGNLYSVADSYGFLTFYAYAAGKTETEFTLPDEVNKIDAYAFYNNKNLTKLDIKSTASSVVRSIGTRAFAFMNLNYLNIQYGSGANTENGVKKYYGMSIAQYAFDGWTGENGKVVHISVKDANGKKLSITTGGLDQRAIYYGTQYKKA